MDKKSATGGRTTVTRRTAVKLLAASGAFGGLGIAAPAIAAPARTLRLGHNNPTNTIYHMALQKFGDELTKLSSNSLKLQIFPAAQLGPISEMLQSVRAGSLDFSMAVPAWYSSFLKPLDVFAMPYMVDSPARLKTALEGTIGEKIEAMSETAGLKIFGHFLLGQRHIANRLRPVNKPEDCAGLKLRVIGSEVFMATFRALGANPVSLDPSELYLALQQKVVDGFEYPLPDILSQRMHEVASYISLDAHSTDFFMVTTGPRTWAKFSPEEQKMVRQAMRTAMDWQWAGQPKSIEDAKAQLSKLINVNDVTPENRKLFADATRPVYKQFEISIGKEWLDLCVKELGPLS